MKMKTKTKRKTKIVMLSTVFLCLFMFSLATTVNAADPPIMSVDYNDEYEVQLLPIRVSVLFDWDDEALINWQLLFYVHLDWDIQSTVLAGFNRVTYSWTDSGAVARPTSVILTIPEAGIYENSSVYFEITYEYLRGGDEVVVFPIKTYKVDILYEGAIADQEQDDMILYICLGSAGAVVLIVLALIYTRKRRR